VRFPDLVLIDGDLVDRGLVLLDSSRGTPRAGGFDQIRVSRVDGVTYLVNGNSGKAPAADPGDGGFVGWTLLRFDPADRREPVRFETHPNVDALDLTGPDHLSTGSPGIWSSKWSESRSNFVGGRP
jgi:hypothetical protein